MFYEMRLDIRPTETGLCLMFDNAFVLRSNGIITRTLLGQKANGKVTEFRFGSELRKEKKMWKGFDLETAKPRDKKKRKKQ